MSDALKRAANVCTCQPAIAEEGERCPKCWAYVVSGSARVLALQQLYLASGHVKKIDHLIGATEELTELVNLLLAERAGSEWLTLPEAADYLSYSEDWVYRHAAEIGGKQAKKGARWMFPRAALNAWLSGDSNPEPEPTPSLPARRRRKREQEADLIPYEKEKAA